MSTSTIYDVKVRYSVDGRAARADTSRLVGGTQDLNREVNRVTGSLSRMGAAVAAAFSVRAGARALIGFNSTVEDTKLQIAGMLALTKKTDLADQFGNADKVFANLQKRAASLPGTTQEYATMAGMLTQPIIDAGLGMKDLEDITVSTVVASKALRVEAGAAARDVDQALRGQFHANDVFTGKLLGSIGYKGEEGRAKYNALPAEQRGTELKRAEMQKQITQLGAAQGQTFSGVMSTLQDTMQQTLGKIGLPLFRAITAEVKNWNTWIDANSAKINTFAHTFADGLVTGFHVVKDVIGFLVSHAGLLVNVAKAWAAIKIGGMVGGFLGGIGGKAGAGGGALLSWFRGARDQFNPSTGGYEYSAAGRGRQSVGGIKGALGNIGMLGQSFGGGFAFGTLLNEWTGASSHLADAFAHLTGRVDETTDKFFMIQRSMDSLDANIARLRGKEGTFGGTSVVANIRGQKATYEQQANVISDALRAWQSGNVLEFERKKMAASQMGVGANELTQARANELNDKAAGLQDKIVGLLTTGADAYPQAFSLLTDYQRQTLDVGKAQQESLAYIQRQLSSGQDVNLAEVVDILRQSSEDPMGTRKSIADKPKVNVTIQRIEVQSDDPDRFAFGLVEAFRSAAKNPSSAIAALREG